MHLLITRPKEQAIKTAERLKALGHSCLIEPLLDIEKLSTPMPKGEFQAIILTSSNSISSLDQHWPNKGRHLIPVLCTGQRTTDSAKSIGFDKATNYNGSAVTIKENFQNWAEENKLTTKTRILYPKAETAAHDLTSFIIKKSYDCSDWNTYVARPRQRFSSTLISAFTNNQIDGVLIYSARTAQTYSNLVEETSLSINGVTNFVLSKDIFDGLSNDLKSNSRYPNEPNEPALFELLNL